MGHENGKGEEVEEGEMDKREGKGKKEEKRGQHGKRKNGGGETRNEKGGRVWLGRKLSFSPLSGNSLLSHEPQSHGATKLLLRIFRQ